MARGMAHRTSARRNRRLQWLIEQRGWTQTEVVERVNHEYEVMTGRIGTYDAERVRRLLSGTTRWPHSDARRALEKVFGLPAHELGLYNPRSPHSRPIVERTGPASAAALPWDGGGEEVDEVRRRELMRAIAALTAAVPSLTAILTGDELERTVGAVAAPRKVDRATLDNIDSILGHARVQDDLLGPQAAIHTVLAQADITEGLVASCPGQHLGALHSLRSRIATSAGWQMFDLGRHDQAGDQFRLALGVADEVNDRAAASMALAEWSGMTEEIGKPDVAAQQAVDAESRAARSGDPRLRAHTAGIAALALARSGDAQETRSALARAEAFDVSAPTGSDRNLTYFVTSGHIARMRAKALHRLGDLPGATRAARESLILQTFRDRAASHILLGAIQVDAGDLDSGVESIIAGAEAETASASARIGEQLTAARRQVWERAPQSAAARTLDDRMAELQLVRDSARDPRS